MRITLTVIFGAALVGCASPDTMAAWDPAVGSFEHADSARTGVFDRAEAFAASSGDPEATMGPAMPGLWNAALDSQGRLFALWGVSGGAQSHVRPSVSRLDPSTMAEIWRVELPLPDVAGLWNYPGAVAVHADGSVYVAYSTRMIRLAPADGRVLAMRDLPAPQGAADTTYNGFIVLQDGLLLAKSHHRKSDCAEQGYRAFVVCGVDGLEPSALVLMEPGTLSIVWSGAAPELIGGRISAVPWLGQEYIYLAGIDQIHRLRRQGRSLEPDPSWGPVRYRQGEETPGTAVVGFGDWVLVQTNALPTTAPLRLTAYHQANSTRMHSVRPFADQPGPWSFTPSKASADWPNRRVYTTEAFSGLVALDFSEETGFQTAWRAETRSGSFISILGPTDSRVLVTTDIGQAQTDAYGAPTHTRESLNWLDGATGSVLGRIEGLPRNFGLTLTPSSDGVIYMATRNSGLVRATPPLERGGEGTLRHR